MKYTRYLCIGPGGIKCNCCFPGPKAKKYEYETGFHSGQTDDPKKVFVQVKEQYPNCNFIFVMDESSQFYVTWSVWRKEFAEE